jgi:ComF family protein
MSLIFPNENLCYICKEKSNYINDFLCSECESRIEYVHKEVDIDSLFIDRCIYSAFYNRFMKELVHWFKFNNKSYLYKPLAEIMIKTIEFKELIKDIDIILYVPIHRRKEAIRGYNQSQLLAIYISKKLNLPLSSNNLTKYKWTKEQNQLKRRERQMNLKDSFKVRNQEELINKNILLIDDILTTGATFDECGRVLKDSGAKGIVGLALTSGKI